MTETIILGGGIAGFAAAIRLAELGERAVLLEAASQFSQKVCGEFISPESLPTLARWGIKPAQRIAHARFVVGDRDVMFDLPAEAGSLSRLEFETQLYQGATERGVDVRLGAGVEAVLPQANGTYVVTLKGGEQLTATNLIFASGRFGGALGSATPVDRPYVGIKAHFTGMDLENCLEMHLLPGAYVGMSSVGNGITNIALLAKKSSYSTHSDADALWQALLAHPNAARLRERMQGAERLFPQWLRVEIPDFGMRVPSSLPHTYAVGDAAGSIPPISGEGLSMALTGGCLAAEYCVKGDYVGYPIVLRQIFISRVRWARLIHHGLLHAPLARLAVPVCHTIPGLVPFLFNHTRGKAKG